MPDFMIDYDGSGQGSEYLTQQTQAIRNLIEALDQAVRSVMSELEGNTAIAYEAKQKEWGLKVDDMGNVLQFGNQTLVDVTQNYLTTDVNEGAKWGGVTVR
ncbi:WXG100 family type VII secretion target [Streptomyces sp. DSM 40750]|uniref:WXG100 family type VII secretion target n=1 Tax=Streptomyces sp. DSM 40750 TaxID=2801030 RepID=UPI00214AAE05|nr:WXG100 family type VII secretion target [Streptomyces sp. DSM 40750]UUU23656.1 WXG100 family type VII secretion target [Streptomyces sp. DSM 40750]